MKKVLVVALSTLFMLAGCSNKSMSIITTENLVIEYGDELDYSKLYNTKKSDENIKLDKVQDFNSKKLGKQEILAFFVRDNETSKRTIIIEVKDTKAPEITLNKNELIVIEGGKVDLEKNIKSVKDPIDGDLKYSEATIDKSGYMINKDKLNTKKAGTYNININAFDINGNTSEKTFKVIVKKKEVKKNKLTSIKESNKNKNPSNTSNANIGSSNNTVKDNKTTSNNKPSSNSGNANKKPSKPSYDPAWENPNGSCHHGHKKAFSDLWFPPGNSLDDYASDYIYDNPKYSTYGCWKCPNCEKWCITNFE